MSSAAEVIAGSDGRWLIVADHSSAAVPPGIDLKVAPAVMGTHIAVDLGVEALSRTLAADLGCPAVLATVSRLVADFNRPLDNEGMVPASSDGVTIAGNVGLSAEAHEARRAWHRDYHRRLAAQVAQQRPRLLLSLHSFTPALATRPDEARPWPVGILWNEDARGAEPAIAALRARGLLVGENQPYSGRELNFSMDVHGEANGIPYTGFEVRQDELADDAGIARWSAHLAAAARAVLDALP
ncbi:N-formylglutamate amidohydrolase [Sandaracinobacteroides saxicola]|uniref:N-formylglutamate amidohydrolase n=1 Tax=Sandaracinobacteroides saxicola TaxID=2759707 RepID=A0A7G5IMX3_9SPHN|nr:N-formylglutamate amidohydrolase [Sandaracinobacteroides saxicola]